VSADETAPGKAIWRQPALWWRLVIVLAGGFGLTFETSSLVYFTVQSNLLVFGYFVGAVYWMLRRRAMVTPAPRLHGGVVLWIVITGLVAHILLNHGANPLPGLVHAPDLWVNWTAFALHYVVPVMVLVDWMLFSPRRAVSWRHIPLWLAYPLGYGLVALARAALYPDFENPYPYYFLDPRTNGYLWVAAQFGILTVEFAVLGAIVVLLNRVTGRAPAEPVSTAATRAPGSEGGVAAVGRPTPVAP
jgi:hypothetical protein